MTVEDVKNSANLGPHASGCLAKSPPDLDNRSNQIPVARDGECSEGWYVNNSAEIPKALFFVGFL